MTGEQDGETCQRCGAVGHDRRTLGDGPKAATCTRCLAGVIYDPTEEKGIMLLHLEEPCGAADRHLQDLAFPPE